MIRISLLPAPVRCRSDIQPWWLIPRWMKLSPPVLKTLATENHWRKHATLRCRAFNWDAYPTGGKNRPWSGLSEKMSVWKSGYIGNSVAAHESIPAAVDCFGFGEGVVETIVAATMSVTTPTVLRRWPERLRRGHGGIRRIAKRAVCVFNPLTKPWL